MSFLACDITSSPPSCDIAHPTPLWSTQMPKDRGHQQDHVSAWPFELNFVANIQNYVVFGPTMYYTTTSPNLWLSTLATIMSGEVRLREWRCQRAAVSLKQTPYLQKLEEDNMAKEEEKKIFPGILISWSPRYLYPRSMKGGYLAIIFLIGKKKVESRFACSSQGG